MDPTVIHQLPAGTSQPDATEPAGWTSAGGQVVVGHIPAQRPGFRLRPALLGQLYQASDETPLTVLTGTWGVGKTQLAGAYARGRLEGGWRLVAWIDAQDSERLLAGLTAVADAVGLPHGGSQRPAADAGQAVRHWLEADGRR